MDKLIVYMKKVIDHIYAYTRNIIIAFSFTDGVMHEKAVI